MLNVGVGNVERVSVEREAVFPFVPGELGVFGELAKEVLGLAEDGGWCRVLVVEGG